MLRNSWLIVVLIVFISCAHENKGDSPDGSNTNVRQEVISDSIGPNEDKATEVSYMNKGLNPLADDWKIDTLNPPIMDWDTNHYNFGEIKQGDVVEHDFIFTNTGKSPLIIKEAYGSCGCTVPHYPSKAIKPGESDKIKVVFNSSSKTNRVFKQIVVIANTYPEDANVISIGATVIK